MVPSTTGNRNTGVHPGRSGLLSCIRIRLDGPDDNVRLHVGGSTVDWRERTACSTLRCASLSALAACRG